MKAAVAMVVVVLGGTALADDDGAVSGFEATGSGPLSGRAVDANGTPLRRVEVHVVSKSGGEHVVKTDDDGRYTVELEGAVTETSLIFVRGHRGAHLGGIVADSTFVDGAEAIEIHETQAPATVAKPPDGLIHIHAYSAKAVADDEWARAWVTLDLDAAGHVRQFKWMHRPGHELEPIVTHDVFDLAFTPARDRSKRPIASQLVWMFEWPSHSWLLQHHVQDTAKVTAMPAEYASVACQKPGEHRKDRRDCTQADLASMLGEAWIPKQKQPVVPARK